MNNGNIVINEFYLFQKNKEKMKEYVQRPEMKEKLRQYAQRSEWRQEGKNIRK
ncbi:hypothetical protein [Spiroplasma endosymbiont of Danaus chrysippus]|uniref:hypothetical protein n=1 Tax=Spiroplasma endosymbiont of Danaus chrysippus TaxID=2691041 RepID=UPI00157B5D9C|nr:hypothetical protein [Spiroplasma endosymbiont of Danaus chrysippus]